MAIDSIAKDSSLHGAPDDVHVPHGERSHLPGDSGITDAGSAREIDGERGAGDIRADGTREDSGSHDSRGTREDGGSRGSRDIDSALAGLDALDLPTSRLRPRSARIWSAAWPKLAAFGLFLLAWQAVVWSGWKPEYVLPGPVPALQEFAGQIVTSHFWEAFARTLTRASQGYLLAIAIGVAVGVAVARSAVLRTAVGSFITALQTMPSIVWFPLAILLFQLTESAIMFVVVLGAAPSVANGVINGIDYVPPLMVRVGRSMGARGMKLYRYVITPAAMPSVLAGLKQGWAFAWRSLMAGELLVVVPGHPSIGAELQEARELSDTVRVLASMMTIFVIGVLVDAAFNAADRRMRHRRGLLAEGWLPKGSTALRASRVKPRTRARRPPR